ncbi:MAG: ThuA domain-containing protein, partial [Prosthecobacter sp.]|nr:ThuA domain-containing protein [Prosthecobacter sp.]
ETKKLHLLSGISGWGWPAVRDEAPALKATVVYASGEKEEFTFVNGVHFSDYIRPIEVPGSRYVEGITDGQQMRLLTLELTKSGPAKTLILESPAGNKTAPVIAAITADIQGRGPNVEATPPSLRPVPAAPALRGKKATRASPAPASSGEGAASTVSGGGAASTFGPKEGGKGDGPLVPASPPQWEAGKTKVLVIGGGSSHNFKDFFGTTDVATLKGAGFSVHYTEDRDQAAAELANADVAIISVNRKFFDTAAYRKALFDFAAAGKGIVMLHPGTWYGYATWPELNAQIVGGGARGHDKIHPFDVKALRADHPVMKDVPASFTVEDELYYVNAENVPEGTTPIEVLAETSNSDKYQKPHPSVWITQHPKARVVGIALGHDARTHDLKPYQQLLINAARWCAGK